MRLFLALGLAGAIVFAVVRDWDLVTADVAIFAAVMIASGIAASLPPREPRRRATVRRRPVIR